MPSTLPNASEQLLSSPPVFPSAPPSSESLAPAAAPDETSVRVLFRSLAPNPLTGDSATRPQHTTRPVFRLDQPIIITIDGPAGTGKSSVARQLAKRLGLDFLDTGAMYRAAAAISIDRGIDPGDTELLVRMVTQADVHFDWSQDPPMILAWDKPVSDRIRAADVTAVVSPIAGIAKLRELMVAKQRMIAHQHPRLVSEGRDQGSVVFPDAHVKFYLTASVEERARRRAQQLGESERAAEITQLAAEIDARDRSDMGRAVGPLTKPVNALVLDTSSLSFDQVVDELEQVVRRKSQEP